MNSRHMETFYAAERAVWRRWLRANYKKKQEIWLVYYRKGSGKPRIGYNDAVEEALCFGWIDSNVRKLDEQSFAQRFSPRNPKSRFSQANKERLRRLVALGRVARDVLASVASALEEENMLPKDILDAIRANKPAWTNFQRFSDAYKRIRVAFIDGARGRPQEFHKRLAYFIRMTEHGRQFGFGGIEKYY